MKLELMLEDISAQGEATDEQLEAFLAENRQSFRQEPRQRFSQVYLNPAARAGTLESDAEELLVRLRQTEEDLNLEQLGDSIMPPKTLPLSSVSVINRQFGGDFTEQLSALEVGTWQGPVLSGYGIHLVLVEERSEGRDPELAEIRPQVEREYALKQRQDLKEKIYSSLREKYTVVIEADNSSES